MDKLDVCMYLLHVFESQLVCAVLKGLASLSWCNDYTPGWVLQEPGFSSGGTKIFVSFSYRPDWS
jgi:hypothetical protein